MNSLMIKARVKKGVLRACFLLCVLPGLCQAETLQLSGYLREGPPCDLAPEDQNMDVDFGQIANKDIDGLGEAGKTDFTLRLINCDLTEASSVVITFAGAHSDANPDWLAPGFTSQAGGIAIAITTREGELLPLGQTSSSFPLVDSQTNRIELSAVVKDASPEPVVPGAFNAMAVFIMDYS